MAAFVLRRDKHISVAHACRSHTLTPARNQNLMIHHCAVMGASRGLLYCESCFGDGLLDLGQVKAAVHGHLLGSNRHISQECLGFKGGGGRKKSSAFKRGGAEDALSLS